MKRKEYIPNMDLVEVFEPHFSKINSTFKDYFKDARIEWQVKLIEYLRENLKRMGYEFQNEVDFFEFTRNRVKRICYSRFDNFHFYLDFKDIDNKGIFIGSYSYKFDLKLNEGIMSFDIGDACVFKSTRIKFILN